MDVPDSGEAVPCPWGPKHMTGGSKRRKRNALPQDVLFYYTYEHKRISVLALVRIGGVSLLGAGPYSSSVEAMRRVESGDRHVAWSIAVLKPLTSLQ